MQKIDRKKWVSIANNFNDLHDALLEKLVLIPDYKNNSGTIQLEFSVPKWSCPDNKKNLVKIELRGIAEINYKIQQSELHGYFTIFEMSMEWLDNYVWIDLMAEGRERNSISEIRKSPYYFAGKEVYIEITPCDD